MHAAQHKSQHCLGLCWWQRHEAGANTHTSIVCQHSTKGGAHQHAKTAQLQCVASTNANLSSWRVRLTKQAPTNVPGPLCRGVLQSFLAALLPNHGCQPLPHKQQPECMPVRHPEWSLPTRQHPRQPVHCTTIPRQSNASRAGSAGIRRGTLHNTTNSTHPAGAQGKPALAPPAACPWPCRCCCSSRAIIS
jgi:hypothetical protein